MADHKYNYQKKIDWSKTAKACRENAKISTKYSVEFGNYFKGMNVNKAIKILTDIIEMNDYLPFVKYRRKVAHRKGETKRNVKSGRFPVKAAAEVKRLLEEVKANAENKNLDVDKLKIVHMFAPKGVTRTSLQPAGRIGGKTRESKSTNIEVIVLEE